MLRLSAALLLALSLPAGASNPSEEAGADAALATGIQVGNGPSNGLSMTYEIFEGTVPHVDLSDCPIPLLGEDRFCRLGIAGENVTVFAFSTEGDQPMIAVRSWPADTILPLLN